jgi:hypothetical protein
MHGIFERMVTSLSSLELPLCSISSRAAVVAVAEHINVHPNMVANQSMNQLVKHKFDEYLELPHLTSACDAF